MKIAYLSGSVFPSRRANTVHVMKMCAAMVRAGHNVVLFGRRSPGCTDLDIFRYYGLEHNFELDLVSSSVGRLVPSVAGAFRLLARSIRFKPDLYYARRRPLAVVASFGSRPLIYEAHEMPIKAHHRRMESQILNSASLRCLVTISEVLAEDYRAAWHHLNSKIIVAHDASDKVPESILPFAIARRPGVPQIGYAGSLYPGKGVEIIAKLAQRHDGMDFHIVGGDEEHIRYWQAKGCPPNVTFHGHIRHADLSSYLCAFDVALAPLQKIVSIDFNESDIGRWTSPLKIFEYMAHRLPIIASDLPSLREVLANGKNSILVPPDDIDGWSEALATLVSSPSFANDLAARARQDFLSKNTWDARVSFVLKYALDETKPPADIAPALV